MTHDRRASVLGRVWNARVPAALIALAFLGQASAAEFDRPWSDPRTALVIDLYSANSIDWNQLATEPRVTAIIHKATSGTNRLDSGYLARKAEAKKRGYLWGSYHWGIAGDPEKQADYYVDTVKPAADELIALDLEDVTSARLMNAAEAIRFVRRVKLRLGRYPVLYTSQTNAKRIATKDGIKAFAGIPLWYAKFSATSSDFPMVPWPTYRLWQFSSESLPQKAIPGTKPDMDVSVFNGTVAQLKASWPFTAEIARGKTQAK